MGREAWAPRRPPFSWGLCAGREWASREPPPPPVAWLGAAERLLERVTRCRQQWGGSPELVGALCPKSRPGPRQAPAGGTGCLPGQQALRSGLRPHQDAHPAPFPHRHRVPRRHASRVRSRQKRTARLLCPGAGDLSTNKTEVPGLPQLTFQASAVRRRIGRWWNVLGIRCTVGGHHRRGAVEDLKGASLDEERSFPSIYF